MASVLDDYDDNFSSLLSEEYEETLSTTLSTTELMSDDDIEPLATEEQAEEYAFEVEVWSSLLIFIWWSSVLFWCEFYTIITQKRRKKVWNNIINYLIEVWKWFRAVGKKKSREDCAIEEERKDIVDQQLESKLKTKTATGTHEINIKSLIAIHNQLQVISLVSLSVYLKIYHELLCLFCECKYSLCSLQLYICKTSRV